MAIRIQLRRDTAANWTSSNPVLRAGELGIETDTLKFKIGNGSSTWTQITNYANVTSTGLANSLNDYILAADQGNAGGPAELDSNGDLLVPENSVILWDKADYTYTTTVTATQPTANRTITLPNATGTVALTSDLPSQYTDELAQDAAAAALAAGTHTNITVTYNDNANSISLAAAPGYVDEQAVDAVAAALAAGTHTNITVGYNDAGNAISLTGAVTYTDENAQDAVGNAVGTGLSYNDTTGAISVDTSTIQARVTNVTDTEIGYLDGVTSAIQTQLNDKLASATASTTYAPIASPTFTGTVTLPGAPTSDLHAATKAYVDAATSGLNVHASVKAATTANIALSTDLENGDTLDGVTLATGNRVLVKNQTDKTENGIYVVKISGTPDRADDYNSAGEVDAGDFIFVEAGTANAKTGYVQTNLITTVGSDNIEFTQFSGAGTYLAGNGLTLTGNSFSINTGTTVDLSTTQTLTNKTLTNPTINSAIITAEGGTPTIHGILLPVSHGISFEGATNNDFETILTVVDPTADNLVSLPNATDTLVGKSTTDTLTNKTINAASNTITVTSANVSDFNEAAQDAIGNSVGTGLTYTDSTGAISVDTTTIQARVADISDTEIGYLNGVTSAIQTQLDGKVDESLFDTKGDILVASADNTPTKLAAGTNGYLLTANSSATNGVEWAAAPVSLPSQSGESGKYLTTDGTTASWGTLVVPITTGTATVTANTATTVDTTALSGFTSIEYMVSLKQGSKVRTSKVVVQTDGTTVDMTEFAITETGGTIAGVVVSAAVSSTNAVLQLTATDAATTNVTVKFSKVAL
jgi:hypothetical protein